MIWIVLRAMLVLCVVSSLAACSEKPPDRPDRGRTGPTPRRTPAAITAPGREATRGAATAGPADHTVVERTVGGLTLREDESVLSIDEAELRRSKEGDEVFVRATVRGPSDGRNCFLMTGATWSALREAIESEDSSEVPEMPADLWADPYSTMRFSSGDTYAVSFQEGPGRKSGAADPRSTPFFALCYKDYGGSTWYDVAHVEGTPEAP